ncbi:Protein kinase C signaling pathway involved MAPKK protein [Tulasnella sp. 403]|nr:Protein kinase C signaling pathway involved MAPKK protein [Tulasnella sp. 403]
MRPRGARPRTLLRLTLPCSGTNDPTVSPSAAGPDAHAQKSNKPALRLNTRDLVDRHLAELNAAIAQIKLPTPVDTSPAPNDPSLWHPDKFVNITKLGAKFEDIWLVRRKECGELFVRKETYIDPQTSSMQAWKEINRRRSYCHRNVVKLYGFFMFSDEPRIGGRISFYTECCDGGSLDTVSRRLAERKRRAPEDIIAKLAGDIFKGLDYIHRQKLIHKRIRPTTILLSRAGEVKLQDWDLPIFERELSARTALDVYAAPERVRGESYTKRVDVWSVGIVLLELSNCKPPLPLELDEREYLYHMMMGNVGVLEVAIPGPNGEPPVIWSREMRDFVTRCLTVPPKERPLPRTMLQHPWLVTRYNSVVGMDDWRIRRALSFSASTTKTAVKRGLSLRRASFRPVPRKISNDIARQDTTGSIPFPPQSDPVPSEPEVVAIDPPEPTLPASPPPHPSTPLPDTSIKDEEPIPSDPPAQPEDSYAEPAVVGEIPLVSIRPSQSLIYTGESRSYHPKLSLTIPPADVNDGGEQRTVAYYDEPVLQPSPQPESTHQTTQPTAVEKKEATPEEKSAPSPDSLQVLVEHLQCLKEREVDAPPRWDDTTFQNVRKLGETSMRTVRLVMKKTSGKLMVTKTISPSPETPPRQLLKELAGLSQLIHPNIVACYGSYLSSAPFTGEHSDVVLLMEACEGGSLETISKMVRRQGKRVGEPVIAKLALGIFEGLNCLHERKIVHRNIKPSNVLVTRDGVVKLAEYHVPGTDSWMGAFHSTAFYMAPERIRGEVCSIRSDVWSAGLTLLEFAGDKYPFPPDLGVIELLCEITDGKVPELQDEPPHSGSPGAVWSQPMKAFIKRCLKPSPEERPLPSEALHDPWLSSHQEPRIRMDKWIRVVHGWPKPSSKGSKRSRSMIVTGSARLSKSTSNTNIEDILSSPSSPAPIAVVPGKRTLSRTFTQNDVPPSWRHSHFAGMALHHPTLDFVQESE